MAAPNAANVFVGAPDQLTTGAVLCAPVGTALPTDARTALNAAFTSSGYVTTEGVTVSPNMSTTSLDAWGAKEIRTVLESFTGRVSWTEMEMTYEALCHAFGASNVTTTAATTTHGTQISVKIDGTIPEAKAWAFNMKDGNARLRIVLPKANPVTMPEMKFTDTQAVTVPIEVACYPDANGVRIYVYTDDGVFTA